MKKIGSLFVALLLSLSLVGSAIASAENGIPHLNDVEPFSVETKKIGDVEVTITKQIIEGNEDDLKKMISQLEAEGQVIHRVPQQSEPTAPGTQSIQVGSNMKVHGSKSLNNGFVDVFTGGSVKLTSHAWGFGGFSITGGVASTCYAVSGMNISSSEAKSRIKVVAYGLVGGNSIVVATYNYYADDWAELSHVDVDEYEGGIMMYLNVDLGTDYKYTRNGASSSGTLWADLYAGDWE